MNRRAARHRGERKGTPTRLTEATATMSAVKAGDWVTWRTSSGKATGRVVSVHTASTVPGASRHLVGSVDAPAARVRRYTKDAATGEWKPGDVFAHKADDLTGIDAPGDSLTEARAVEARSVVTGSFSDLQARVRDAISDRLESASGGAAVPYICIEDMGLGWAVYSVGFEDTDLWQVTWETDAAGAMAIGDATEVQRVTTYVAEDDEDDTTLTEALKERVQGRVIEAKGSDTGGGRIFHAVLIEYGDSLNGNRYTESVLRTAVPKYEGAKAFDRHRSLTEHMSSTIAGLVGQWRNVEATTVGLEGDLHLLPSATHTAEALDASIAAVADGLSPLVGISHDVSADARPIMVGGRRLLEATEILSVNSTDVVANPSAGGRATRMVAGGNGGHNQPLKEGTVNWKQLLELLRATESAKRAGLLEEHKHIVEAAGFTPAEAIAFVEAGPTAPPVPIPAPVPAGAAELIVARESTMGRMLVAGAMREAALPDSLTDLVAKRLPEQFTQAQLGQIVEGYKDLLPELEAAGLRPSVPHVAVTKDEFDKKREKLDKFFQNDFVEGYRSFKQAWADLTGYRGQFLDEGDVNRRILVESCCPVNWEQGSSGMPFDSQFRLAESLTASSWNLALGDSMTRRLIATYQQPSMQAWRAIVSSIVPANDFRTQRRDRIGGYGVLPAVNQGAPYQPLTSPGNEEASYAITKRGGTEDLTMEMIANDDIGAIARIPYGLGLAAAQTLLRYVLDMLVNNITCTYDSVALFASGHGSNTATTALAASAVSAGRKAMRKQTAYGDSSDVLSIVPKTLLVCSDLEELAFEISTSPNALPSGAPTGAATNVPNLHQGLNPIVVDYWSSTTAWFLAADPQMVPMVEMGFYQGRQDPDLFVQSDPTVGSVFAADKQTWKIRHIYAGTPVEHRGLYRGNV